MNENSEKKINEELSILYTSCVAEIAGFKSQQWSTTNYGILSYAAVISVVQLAKPTNCLEWVLLYALAFSISVAGIFMIMTLFNSIHTRRQRLAEVRKHASDPFMVAWGCGKPREKIIDDPDKKLKLTWFFIGIFVVGFGVTIWLLTRQYLSS